MPTDAAPTPRPPRARPAPDAGLADFLPDAYLETDPDGVIRLANAALSALIGYARGYAVGKPVQVLFMAAARDAVGEAIARAAREPRPHEFESTLRPRRDGQPRTVRARLGAIRDEGGAPAGLRWLIRDVTEERAMAAALRDAEARRAAAVRAETMELEMTVRLLRAQLADRSPAHRPPPDA